LLIDLRLKILAVPLKWASPFTAVNFTGYSRAGGATLASIPFNGIFDKLAEERGRF